MDLQAIFRFEVMITLVTLEYLLVSVFSLLFRSSFLFRRFPEDPAEIPASDLVLVSGFSFVFPLHFLCKILEILYFLGALRAPDSF